MLRIIILAARRIVILMRNIVLLIKPASSSCNLRCGYCFYADVSANRDVKNYGLMSPDTAEIIIGRALEESRRILFCFQGGEPTLWGLGNFQRFADTVDRLNTNRAEIHYALQTNGILLDDGWAEFLKKRRFLAGLSLDGYKELHDASRMDAAGKGSYNNVLRAASLLRKYHVEFNILSVITSDASRHAEKLYRFFQQQNLSYLQFIPCINDFGSAETGLTDVQYGQFLRTMFDLWFRDHMAGRGVSIRYFDNVLGMLMGHPPEQCSMKGTCHVQFTVEADGGVYPCDFYVLDEWRLGDVRTDKFSEMRESDTAKRFIAQSEPIRGECALCRWAELCRGGCRRDKEPILGGVPSSNRFCLAYRDFFDYSYERFMKLCTYYSR